MESLLSLIYKYVEYLQAFKCGVAGISAKQQAVACFGLNPKKERGNINGAFEHAVVVAIIY